MTFSVVARSPDGEGFGVAVASKFLAVGAAVPAARVGAGAVATQAMPNLAFKPEGLARMATGVSARHTLADLVAADLGRDERQCGMVDASGGSASYTGAGCMPWAGGRTEADVAIQGNILAGPQVIERMYAAWVDTAADPDFGMRLLDVLGAGDGAGGDRRGRQSAALLIVRPGAGYGDDVEVDLRVDDHPDPVAELRRMLGIHAMVHRAPEEADRIRMDAALRDRVETAARAAGHPDFDSWVGVENYELRVAHDHAWVDRRLLGFLGLDGS
ncbi:MAG: DUF1028 domain-containing protein [Dermatophilaceae bacterium]